MPDDFAHLKDWVGRTQDVEETIWAERVANMAATLDLETAPKAGDPLPPGWHWLFFNGFVYRNKYVNFLHDAPSHLRCSMI